MELEELEGLGGVTIDDCGHDFLSLFVLPRLGTSELWLKAFPNKMGSLTNRL